MKTTLTPLASLGDKDLLDFVRAMVSWPDEVAAYKGRGVWGRCAMEFCKQRLSEGIVEDLLKHVM